MRAWIEEHPLLAGIGALLFFVLIFVLVRRGGSSGSQVIQTGPSEGLQAAQLSAAVQLASINAQTNLQGSQLAASLAAKKIDAQTTLAVSGAQKDVALTGILSDAQTRQLQTDAALQASQYSTQGIVQTQRIVSDAAVRQTGIQADVINQQTRAQLEAQGIISKATVDVATLQSGSDQARTAAALAAIRDTNASNVTLGLDTNQRDVSIATVSGKTATDLATLDAQTKQLSINAAAGVANNFITTQGTVTNAYIDTQGSLAEQRQSIIDQLLRTGQINKGGEGGANQVAVIDTLFGNIPGSVAASNASGAQGVAGANMLGNIVSSIQKGFSSFFSF